ncbi:energy-coupling factor transporter transmembrane component T family protein [Paracoccus siganidrum]|uniref:Energy-coupling factor transporter transmembrane protein EcfT n=1 Tax=Paracoccus siganidrum TaxID=1276757 RepID=A0A419AAD6_9RHOB|nr:energy-coupling factor transporter transmembrane component T [Paracoccus siganidrum]RJL19701.1 energy-coupling factor transporter transmembrane protein EcfT [Paracoccus siganidrum]RMC35916.1 energy-coupling factor transporter transmembrane protein EcfT [Paracoccus siganidrum]
MISLTSPVETRAHRWPAGVKLGALCLASTGLFLTGSAAVHVAALLLVLALYAAPGRVFLQAGLRSLRVVLPFVAILLVWHAVTGELRAGALIVLRMVTLVALANLVTMTTGLGELVDLIRRLTAPLRRLGLPTHLLETAIPLVIRFTPVLVARAENLAEAWRARSRRRPGWRLILPLTLQALDDADHVGEALRARGGPLGPQ